MSSNELIDTQVNTARKIETLRQLRNLTTDGFSTFNGHISMREQFAWWRSMAIPPARVKAWLYWHINDCRYVGFGVLREQDGKWWNSIGVHPEYQRRGYGSYITEDLLRKHGGPIYATVRRDNTRARAMHNELDWEEIEGPEPERLVYLRSRVPNG